MSSLWHSVYTQIIILTIHLSVEYNTQSMSHVITMTLSVHSDNSPCYPSPCRIQHSVNAHVITMTPSVHSDNSPWHDMPWHGTWDIYWVLYSTKRWISLCRIQHSVNVPCHHYDTQCRFKNCWSGPPKLPWPSFQESWIRHWISSLYSCFV